MRITPLVCAFFLSVPLVATPEPKPIAQVTLRVAAAANLILVLEKIADRFMLSHAEVRIEAVYGSSGNLAAQVLGFAPYDLFLSADRVYPEKILAAGLGWGKVRTYAYGLLCLASRHELDPDKGLGNLAENRFGTIAIAKPKLAPYGAASVQCLSNSGLANLLTKVIWAENISQAYQYVKTGATDAGFVALSAVTDISDKSPGERLYFLQVDAALYDRIEQGLVILDVPDRRHYRSYAIEFAEFLSGLESRDMFMAAGYGLPDIPAGN
jgi:molybdate transport system substrate-binding protein